jgi:flagellin-specific chaperone FliS
MKTALKSFKATYRKHTEHRNQRLSADQMLDAICNTYHQLLASVSLRNRARSIHLLKKLSASIDYTHEPELALSFQELFAYCLERIERNAFEDAYPVIRTLDNAWNHLRQMHPANIS